MPGYKGAMRTYPKSLQIARLDSTRKVVPVSTELGPKTFRYRSQMLVMLDSMTHGCRIV